jgi:hypothetical protein
VAKKLERKGQEAQLAADSPRSLPPMPMVTAGVSVLSFAADEATLRVVGAFGLALRNGAP